MARRHMNVYGRERKIQKGKPYGRILKTVMRNGREYSYHATKGWRSRLVEAVAA